MTRPIPTKAFFLSNNNMPIFKSELTNESELRVLGSHDVPLFIAKDIATMLEYKNTNKAINDHIDKEDILTYENYKKSIPNGGLENGGNESLAPILQPQTKLINESGLYCLILRSKNEKAKLFKKWITTEVLPSIRKTGEYKFNQTIQELTHKYDKLRQIHNSLKFKRNYHQLEVGDCVYVCHNRLEPPNRFKIGKTNNINHTLKIYRRIAPYVLLDFLFFTTKMSLLEDILLTKYKDERRPINHELVEDIALETIIQDINLIINLIKIPGSVGSAESIDIYNKDINTPDVYACIVESEEEEDEEDEDEEDEEEEEEEEEEDEINILIENRVELLEEEAELIDERIEEVVTIVDERLAKVEARVQVIEETQKQEYMTLLKEMENYTEAKLKEWLVKLRLSVTGNKTVKKQKIKDHLKKISIVLEDINYKQYRECDTCKESKLLNINNYRKFVYGYNNRCIVCDLKSCERVVKLREDIKTEITETTYTGVCSNCKNVVALDDFYKNKANPSGRESQCKNCSIKGKNIRNNDGVLKPMRKINKKVECDDDHKHCIECDMIKSKEEFLKSASRKDGYQTYCKNCDTTRNRKNRMLRKLNGTKKID